MTVYEQISKKPINNHCDLLNQINNLTFYRVRRNNKETKRGGNKCTLKSSSNMFYNLAKNEKKRIYGN